MDGNTVYEYMHMHLAELNARIDKLEREIKELKKSG